MLRQMADMPAGTIGFEAAGKVDDDDFEHVVEPVLRREIAAGHRIRLLYLLGVGLASGVAGAEDSLHSDSPTAFTARTWNR